MKDRADQMITQRAGADDQTTRVSADQMINDRADQMIKLLKSCHGSNDHRQGGSLITQP